MRFNNKKIAVIALAATFFFVSISSLAEEIESRKLSILEATGSYTYVKKANGREFKATKGMGLGQGNEIITGAGSKIYIEADNDKVIRLDEDTIVEITKASAKSLKLTLHSGNLFFNVDKPLGSDEEMTFEAAHTSMSIRGTSGVFSFNPLKMEFFLVEGSVQWDLGDGNVVELKAGETIEMVRDTSTLGLGPGVEGVYTFNKKVPFQWTDLDDDSLEAIMENRALIDLTSIGLDTPEEIKQAADKVEEYRKEKELEESLKKSKNIDDDDDDDYTYIPETSPSEEPSSTAAETSVATDTNAGESSGEVNEASSEEQESSSEETEESSEEQESSSEETESSSQEPESSTQTSESSTSTQPSTELTLEEKIADATPAGKKHGVDGEVLWSGDELVWIDYEVDVNAYMNDTYGKIMFKDSWLSTYGYATVLVDAE